PEDPEKLVARLFADNQIESLEGLEDLVFRDNWIGSLEGLENLVFRVILLDNPDTSLLLTLELLISTVLDLVVNNQVEVITKLKFKIL
ncbi:11857_t:CDS:2, partial [Cetraspora pellucida]